MEITGVHTQGQIFGVGKFRATKEELFNETFLEEVDWQDYEIFLVEFDLEKFLDEHQGQFVYVVHQTDTIDDDDEIETTFTYRWYDEQGQEVNVS
jgi:hypothetical protein